MSTYNILIITIYMVIVVPTKKWFNDDLVGLNLRSIDRPHYFCLLTCKLEKLKGIFCSFQKFAAKT